MVVLLIRDIADIRDKIHAQYALATLDTNVAITVSLHNISWDVEQKDDDGLIDVAGANPHRFTIPASWIPAGETEVLVEMVAQVHLTAFTPAGAFSVNWFVNGSVIEGRGFTREATVPIGGEVVQTAFSGPSLVEAGDILTVVLGGPGATGTLQGAATGSSTWAMVRRLG